MLIRTLELSTTTIHSPPPPWRVHGCRNAGSYRPECPLENCPPLDRSAPFCSMGRGPPSHLETTGCSVRVRSTLCLTPPALRCPSPPLGIREDSYPSQPAIRAVASGQPPRPTRETWRGTPRTVRTIFFEPRRPASRCRS